ncbi:MAG: EamA family transporter [Thermodesulfovibrionia bacterium]|nr:EamA family transporter [Thermodesulfovibrionia bacterium]
MIYSLSTAFLFATSDALTKRALALRDEYLVAWARLLFSLPILFISLMFIEIPPLNRSFWVATLCALPLEISAIILYTRALKISPISLSVPYLALTPIFLIITSYLLLGEKVSMSGGAGIFLIAAGSYSLNLHKARHRLIDPLKALYNEKGSVLMIIVAFIYSITSSLGKIAIENSSPLFFGSFYFILITFFFTPIAVLKNKGNIVFTKRDIIPLTSIGITYSLMIITHMLALSLTKVAYMISIKRSSLLFSIFYGYLLFKEEKTSERALGGIIMFAGFVLIILST